MGRVALVIRLFTALTLAFWLAGATSLSAVAQDDSAIEGTPPAGEEAPPTEEQPAEQAVLQGTLTIYVFTCTDGPGDLAGGLFLEGEFAPSEACVEEGTAAISIDGGPAEAVNSGAQYTLDAGVHTVVEQTLGVGVDIAVPEEEATALYAVFYAAAPEAAEEVVPGTVVIMKHVCPEAIQSQEDFDALGDFIAKVQACPVITLPGNMGPDGAVNANDPDSPLSFDFQVAYGESLVGIDTATFVPEQICEADLGDINGDPNDNVCLDTSHYAYESVNQGPVTVTEVTPPDGYMFGALEFTPDSGDETTLIEVVAEEGRIELDTTGDESVVLHVYNFQKPAENRVNIVKHQCPEEITADDYAQLGGFVDKIATCPVVLRGDHDGPEGAISGGHRTFAFEVEGSDGTLQTLEDNATFVPHQVCEDEIGDINGDPNDNICLDASYYQFDGVTQGPGVLIVETKSPGGYEYGGVELDPETDDAAALVNASDDGVIELDTTADGEVTLHVFNIKSDEPEPTPTLTPTVTPTRTPTVTPTTEPSPYGTVQIIKLFCYGDVEESIITVLGPGEEATADQMGDSSCVAGSADFSITLFGVDELAVFDVGDDGFEALGDLPVTDSESGLHVLTEIYSGATAEFEIESETTTRLIVLNYVVEDESLDEEDDEIVDGEEAVGEAVIEEDVNDEETIESGDDLAETGFGPMNGSADTGMVLTLGAAGLLMLAGASLTRRRTA